MKRATEARESFKRTRLSEEGTTASRERRNAVETGALTAAEKYDKRLRNNRRSAAASRIYNGVLMFEITCMLKEIETECEYLANDNECYRRREIEVSEKIQKLSSACAQLAADLAELRAKMLREPFSPDRTASYTGNVHEDAL